MRAKPDPRPFRSIAGGALKRPSVLEVVARYAESRGAPASEEQQLAVEMALELITRFFEIGAPPAPARRGEQPMAARVRADRLVPALGPCVRLFPFANMVRASWIPVFAAEAGRLAHWCLGQGLCDRAALRRFERELARARPDHERFYRLQHAIERFPSPPALTSDSDALLEGRFRVAGDRGGGMRLVVPGEVAVAPVRLPAAVREAFRKGYDVGMLLAPGPAGWWPVASTLPVSTGKIARLAAAAERALAPPRGPRAAP